MPDSSTQISGRPQHRAPRLGDNPMPDCLALDWVNGQAFDTTASSQASTVFDASNDRCVLVSCSGGAFITVGPVGTTVPGSGAGTLNIPISAVVPIYVPAGYIIAAIQGASGALLTMVPALLTGS